MSPSRARQPLGGTPPLSAYFLDDNAYNREGDAFWVRGESRADIMLRAPIVTETTASGESSRPLARSRVSRCMLETGPRANRVVISTGAETRVVDMPPSSQQTIELADAARPAVQVPTRASRPITSTDLSIESATGFMPMFENGGARQPLPRRVRAAGPVRVTPSAGTASVATVAVVTSSPPFAEGGHLVMARELVRALREAGHAPASLVTPQNRFGRQGSAYLAAWCTDVGAGPRGAPVDQVISLRFPAYAVRHPHHVLWLNHRMREYYDLWDQFSAHLSWKARHQGAQCGAR